MKKINFLLIFLIPILISNCGYQPKFVKKDLNFNISEIQSSGEKSINSKIIKNLNKFKNSNKAKQTIKVFINTEKNITVVTKDEKGNDSKFLLNIISDVKIYENEKLIKEKTFIKDFTYKNIENKLDLSQYKKQIEQNLINKIIEEISIFFYSL